ncbi:MAG: hypothetical protein GDA55_04430 [Cellvibrionales bacterium]|nr:hypothetical protein [Cellvibrionales bacterium]
MNASLHSLKPVGQANFAAPSPVPLSLPVGDMRGEDSAAKVLELLLAVKRHCRQRNHSHMERFGEPDTWCDAVLADLDESIGAARRLLDGTQLVERSSSPAAPTAIRLALPA